MEFPAVGYRNDTSGSLYVAGTDGYYWSSVASASYSGSADYLYFHSSSLNVTNGYGKRGGFSVRCVR
ncbi:MAG: fibrobacter succinogenes major paralogous domain-containing protein [Rikenellaceae bacterium]|nr:fibrobacter succinogenes major paralogous domain-containing protein [Rikenellaceae bacterium]